MPAKAAPSNVRDTAINAAASLVCSRQCSLPLWDDTQIAQENWGSPLSATASASGGASDASQDFARQNTSKPKSSADNHAAPNGPPATSSAGLEGSFEDSVGHRCVTDFIQAHRPLKAKQNDTAVATAEEVTWKRPVDVFRPFRPVVHRNATPFVDPYATDDALTPTEGKVKEEAGRVLSSAGGTAGSNSNGATGSGGKKRSTAGLARSMDGTGTTAAVTEAFHQQYPEAVTILEDFVGDNATLWSHCTSLDAVRRYRSLPTLMQPYDGALVAGCAETPAEACGSRYSTALRHRLKQAEQLSALPEAPPFLMTALDSALLAVEQAQRYIPAGSYLWELVHPHAPGTCHPVYNPFGKYAVKLFVAGAYRKVVVDDRLPVDVLGRPLLATTSRKELWPALLGKAIIKALGPVTGAQALATSPDLIVSVLLGNWVPQYLSPRHETVSTMATLLLYERHLKQLSTIHAPLLQDNGVPVPANKGDDVSGKMLENGGGTSGGGDSGGNQAARRRSSVQRKRGASITKEEGKPAGSVSSDAQQRLYATEYSPATIDEPVTDQCMYACGLLRVPSAAGIRDVRPTANLAQQLLTIHAVKPFRHTFALLLHTTPRIELAPGVFEKEKDADDVNALLHWGRQHQTSALLNTGASSGGGGDYGVANVQLTPTTEMVMIDNARSSSVTSCWLTIEEFMAQMDQVVVWRVLQGKYAQTKSVTGETILLHHGLSGAADTANNSNNNADAPASSGKQVAGSGGQKNPSPPRDDASGAGAAAAATASGGGIVKLKPSGAGQGSSVYPSTLSPTCLWWKLTATTAMEAVVVVSCPTLTEAPSKTTYAEGAASLLSDGAESNDADVTAERGKHLYHTNDAAAVRERRVDVHHFQWDRAEPLNHVGSFTYTDGALRSTVLRFRPGTHVLRVDFHRLQPADTIAFLSDGSMEVQLSLAHDFAQDGFATVTDAGAYPAMPLHDVEYIWLKRVFTLAMPTCLTVVLSTLDTAEDVAAHRCLNTVTQRATTVAAAVAPPAGKTAHSKGAAAAAVGPVTTKKSSTIAIDTGKRFVQQQQQTLSRVASAGAAEALAEPHSVSLLRSTTLLLVNMDEPEKFHVGSAGRLVHLRLDPNEKGYLIMAYTTVPAAQRRGVAACNEQEPPADDGVGLLGVVVASSTAVTPAETAAGDATESASAGLSTAADVAEPLFPAGQWKLTLRSDAELQSFNSVAHDSRNVVVEADLPRGGSPVLFRRVCTVVEPTHLSLFAQLRAPFPMAFTVRITRPGTAVTPTAVAATELATPSTTNTTTPTAASKGTNTASITSPLLMNEPAFSTEGAVANALTVYESEATDGRLFVADVFLSCTLENGTRVAKTTGGGAGGNAAVAPTTYIIEAVVSQASADVWNDQCQRRQEATFAQVRGNAEVRAATHQQHDWEEYQHDPAGFLQRRKEAAAKRRQQLTETAEKTVTHAQVDATANAGAADARGSRGRRSSSGRRQSHRVSSAVDTFIKDTFRRLSSSLQEDALSDAASLALLDAPDPASLVHLSTQIYFSSPRAELKEDGAPQDPVAELRQHMKETVSWLQGRIYGESGSAVARAGVRGVSAGVSSGSAVAQSAPSASSGSVKSQVQRSQKDSAAATALSVEDALHAKMAFQSRLAYLRNPQNIFLPAFEVTEGSNYSEGAATNTVSTVTGTPANGALNSTKAKPHDGGGAAAHAGTTSLSTTAPALSPHGAGGHKESVVAASVPLSSITSVEAGAAAVQSSTSGSEVVLQDGVATRFRYAAPLTPSRYRVELLPLRSYEESLSTSPGRDKEAGVNGISGASTSKRPKASTVGGVAVASAAKAQSSSAAGPTGGGAASITAVGGSAVGAGAAGSAPGCGNVSFVGASSLSCAMTTAECDAALIPLQAPLLNAMRVWEQAAASTATTRPAKGERRARFRTSYQSYFETAAAQKAVTAGQGSGEGGDATARHVVYHSLLGLKEEDTAVGQKSRKMTAAA
jgi:hypothetical protein